MGDFNAKIGMDNTGYEDIMGTHGLGQMNENGERFADLCALNQLVIGGSIFPHKHIHKATWISPNHVTENQIDNICICRKFRRSWQDVRVMRGADVSSDHHLLMTTVKLRLKRFTTANSTRTKYNVGLLRDKDTQAAFQISLSNRFQPLQDREVKRSIKKDKRDYIDDLARQAETAAGQGNLRDLYLVTKKLTGKFQ